MKEYYKPGDYWMLCDQCQLKMRASESGKRWDGLIVHKDPKRGCMESRHPQEFVRAVPDQKPLPVVRPDNDGLEPTVEISALVTGAAYNTIPSGTFGDYDP